MRDIKISISLWGIEHSCQQQKLMTKDTLLKTARTHQKILFYTQKNILGAGEITQWLQALVTLLEDLGYIYISRSWESDAYFQPQRVFYGYNK